MKCSKCKRNATYDSPRPLCKRHWAEWWVGPKAKNTDVGKKWVESISREPMTEMDVLTWVAEAAYAYYMRPTKTTKGRLRVALFAAGRRPRLRKALLKADIERPEPLKRGTK